MAVVLFGVGADAVAVFVVLATAAAAVAALAVTVTVVEAKAEAVAEAEAAAVAVASGSGCGYGCCGGLFRGCGGNGCCCCCCCAAAAAVAARTVAAGGGGAAAAALHLCTARYYTHTRRLRPRPFLRGEGVGMRGPESMPSVPMPAACHANAPAPKLVSLAIDLARRVEASSACNKAGTRASEMSTRDSAPHTLGPRASPRQPRGP